MDTHTTRANLKTGEIDKNAKKIQRWIKARLIRLKIWRKNRKQEEEKDGKEKV